MAFPLKKPFLLIILKDTSWWTQSLVEFFHWYFKIHKLTSCSAGYLKDWQNSYCEAKCTSMKMDKVFSFPTQVKYGGSLLVFGLNCPVHVPERAVALSRHYRVHGNPGANHRAGRACGCQCGTVSRRKSLKPWFLFLLLLLSASSTFSDRGKEATLHLLL